VVVVVGGPGFPTGAVPSPFVTSTVLEALQSLGPRSDTRPLIERGLAYLLGEMEGGGYWRFYHCSPPLRPDLDSTSLALLALQRGGISLDYVGAARRLRSHQDVAGRFQTWASDTTPFLERVFRSPLALLRPAFNVVDPVVNVNVIALQRAVGLDAPEAERFVIAHAGSAESASGTPYYLYPECFAHASSRILETTVPGDPLAAACASLVERQMGNTTPSTTQSFRLMRLLVASLRLRCSWLDPTNAVRAALSTQLPDGSWPWGPVWTAVRWARGSPRPLLGSPAVETAIALEVLGRALAVDSRQDRSAVSE
jgi:hypothetical protein